MITFQRIQQRELLRTLGSSLLVLFAITLTVILVRLLGQAAQQEIASSDLLLLIGFSTLNYLPTLIVLALFISVLWVMSRNYYDAEMMIWQGSGLSLWQFVRVHSRVILLTVFSIALLSFLLTPWSNQQSTEIRERFAKRSDIARISAGQFIESSKGQRIFFVEAVDPALRFIRHVFVASIVGNTTDITVAQQGHTEFDREGNHFIVLEKGRRYQQVEQTLDARLLEFKRYQFRINEAPPDMTINLSIRAKTTLELIASHDGEARAELARRMGMPIMGLLLAFLAIPLSAVNPRAGRSFHLIAAVLIFVVYTNGLNIMQSLILQNRLSFNWACWALHGVIALLVLALLTWHVEHNHQHHPIRYWLKMKAYWRR